MSSLKVGSGLVDDRGQYQNDLAHIANSIKNNPYNPVTNIAGNVLGQEQIRDFINEGKTSAFFQTATDLKNLKVTFQNFELGEFQDWFEELSLKIKNGDLKGLQTTEDHSLSPVPAFIPAAVTAKRSPTKVDAYTPKSRLFSLSTAAKIAVVAGTCYAVYTWINSVQSSTLVQDQEVVMRFARIKYHVTDPTIPPYFGDVKETSMVDGIYEEAKPVIDAANLAFNLTKDAVAYAASPILYVGSYVTSPISAVFSYAVSPIMGMLE